MNESIGRPGGAGPASLFKFRAGGPGHVTIARSINHGPDRDLDETLFRQEPGAGDTIGVAQWLGNGRVEQNVDTDFLQHGGIFQVGEFVVDLASAEPLHDLINPPALHVAHERPDHGPNGHSAQASKAFGKQDLGPLSAGQVSLRRLDADAGSAPMHDRPPTPAIAPATRHLKVSLRFNRLLSHFT